MCTSTQYTALWMSVCVLLAPHWIQFSSSQLVLTQLFLVSSVYITRWDVVCVCVVWYSKCVAMMMLGSLMWYWWQPLTDLLRSYNCGGKFMVCECVMWSVGRLVMVFEFSSITSFVYDLVLKLSKCVECSVVWGGVVWGGVVWVKCIELPVISCVYTIWVVCIYTLCVCVSMHGVIFVLWWYNSSLEGRQDQLVYHTVHVLTKRKQN